MLPASKYSGHYCSYFSSRSNRCRIQNPLLGISKDRLYRDVEVFAESHGLTDITTIMQKGALAAQNPRAIEQMPEFDEDDRVILRKEITNRWAHPKILYFTIVLNSIAAAIQGWDQTGSNGANLSFPAEFGISDSPDSSCTAAGTCDKNSWLIGFVNSCPYICIAFL